MKEFHLKYRPKSLKQIIGQTEAVRILSEFIKSDAVPHAILFHGPTGCGKTTLARVMAKKVGCHKKDFHEYNTADFRGVDTIRDLRKFLNQSPMMGDNKVYLIDECHQLTGTAEEALLKMLEDTPSWVYFFLATTNPEKLKKTTRGRCTSVAVKAMTASAMKELLEWVCKKEDLELEEEVEEAILDHSEGSARQCLVLLNTIAPIEGTEDRLTAIASVDEKENAVQLARELIKPKPSWRKVADFLKQSEDDPEGLRRMVLGYCNSVLLGGGKLAPRAAVIIEAFRDNLFDSGKAGLAVACWEVVNG